MSVEVLFWEGLRVVFNESAVFIDVIIDVELLLFGFFVNVVVAMVTGLHVIWFVLVRNPIFVGLTVLSFLGPLGKVVRQKRARGRIMKSFKSSSFLL